MRRSGHIACARVAPANRWTWNEVEFTVLHPALGDEGWRSSNDLSCVLRIDNGRYAALLPGDISQSVEFKIMRSLRPVHLLLAPHHGSRTSLFAQPVAQIAPSTGAGERWIPKQLWSSARRPSRCVALRRCAGGEYGKPKVH